MSQVVMTNNKRAHEALIEQIAMAIRTGVTITIATKIDATVEDVMTQEMTITIKGFFNLDHWGIPDA